MQRKYFPSVVNYQVSVPTLRQALPKLRLCSAKYRQNFCHFLQIFADEYSNSCIFLTLPQQHLQHSHQDHHQVIVLKFLELYFFSLNKNLLIIFRRQLIILSLRFKKSCYNEVSDQLIRYFISLLRPIQCLLGSTNSNFSWWHHI